MESESIQRGYFAPAFALPQPNKEEGVEIEGEKLYSIPLLADTSAIVVGAYLVSDYFWYGCDKTSEAAVATGEYV